MIFLATADRSEEPTQSEGCKFQGLGQTGRSGLSGGQREFRIAAGIKVVSICWAMDPNRIASRWSQKADIGVPSGEMPGSIDFEFYFFWSGLTQTVRFYARHEGSRIRCAVTRTALEHCAGSLKARPPADLERVFEQHRHEIERLAVDKILARRFQGDGSVLIRAVDLSP
jgi:hypothetical protein